MRSVSNRFKDLGLGKSKESSSPTNNDHSFEGNENPHSPAGATTTTNTMHSPGIYREHTRTASGSGEGAGIGKQLKAKVAHTTILPNIIGSQSLRELQDFITAEKSVLQSNERLASDLQKSNQTLTTWGSSEGSDLSDVLSHASSILNHFSQAFLVYAGHEEGIRRAMKDIRTKEEELEELIKKRKSIGGRAEREEKKLARMGQEVSTGWANGIWGLHSDG